MRKLFILILGGATTMIGGFSLLGYIVNVSLFYTWAPRYTAMAFNTSIGFVFIGVCLILICCEHRDL